MMKMSGVIVAMTTSLLVLLAASPSWAEPTPTQVMHRAEPSKPTAAYRWLQVLLEASGREVDRNKPRPTILSRTMAIVLTSMYDAWAAYDVKAVGTRLGGALRRPANEHTQANKEKAIAFAAYRALLFVYAEDAEWIREQFRKLGFDPDDESSDTRTPAGIGNTAAGAVVAYRTHDGANQLGDEIGADGKPYADYTYYASKNTPEKIADPSTWLPIPFSDGKGGKVRPPFLTPHWYRVKPFAIGDSKQFRPGPPPVYGSEQLKKEVDEAIALGAALTLEQRAIVEFMRDGPRSTGQSGHWLQFAQDVSRRDHLALDEDMKLFFSIGNIVFDAFIACWDTKRYYDSSRPYWWARLYYKDQDVSGWLGPSKGVGKLKGDAWHPYSPDTFVTPPFPGYVSGHATASGAAAKILELFTGSDAYGGVEVRDAGSMTETEATLAQMLTVDGVAPKELPSSRSIRIEMPTFSGTADMAAMSRLWGGYHIRTDNEEGLKMGRALAAYSWPRYQAYFDGTAAIRN